MKRLNTKKERRPVKCGGGGRDGVGSIAIESIDDDAILGQLPPLILTTTKRTTTAITRVTTAATSVG